MLKYVASVIGGLFIFVAAVVAAQIEFGHQQTAKVDLTASVVRVEFTNGHGTAFYLGNGKFITAGHVAKEGLTAKMLLINEHGKVAEARVVWIDEKRDVALIEAPTFEPDAVIPAVAKMTCSLPDAPVGAPVRSIGYPLNLGLEEAFGHVSGASTSRSVLPVNSLVADLTIAPGNSGGPVFDAAGEVIGMSDAIALTALNVQWVPFAIPTSIPFAILVPRSEMCAALSEVHPAPDAPTLTNAP